MNDQSEPSRESSSLSQLRGFAPLDEPPDVPSCDRWWRWSACGFLCLALTGIGIGALQGSWANAVSWGTILGIIGLAIGARLGRHSDLEALEERIRSDCDRKDREDLILAHRLAEAGST